MTIARPVPRVRPSDPKTDNPAPGKAGNNQTRRQPYFARLAVFLLFRWKPPGFPTLPGVGHIPTQASAFNRFRVQPPARQEGPAIGPGRPGKVLLTDRQEGPGPIRPGGPRRGGLPRFPGGPGGRWSAFRVPRFREGNPQAFKASGKDRPFRSRSN